MILTIKTRFDGLQIIGVIFTIVSLLTAVTNRTLISIILLIMGSLLYSVGLREYTNKYKTLKGKFFWQPALLIITFLSIIAVFVFGRNLNNYPEFFLIAFSAILNHLLIFSLFRQFRIEKKTRTRFWVLISVVFVNALIILFSMKDGFDKTTYGDSGTPDWIVNVIMVNLLILITILVVKLVRWVNKLVRENFGGSSKE